MSDILIRNADSGMLDNVRSHSNVLQLLKEDNKLQKDERGCGFIEGRKTILHLVAYARDRPKEEDKIQIS